MAWFGKRDAEAGTPQGAGDEPGAGVVSEDAADESAVAEGAGTEDVAADGGVAGDVATTPVATAPAVSAAVVFQPGPPIDGWHEAVDAPLGAGGEPAAGGAPALEWAIKANPLRPKGAPRTPLQEAVAEIAEKHKDGPVEDMAGPIREALAAHGREVPDDWILAIAEGLRQHGPISLNLGGPGPVPR